MKVGWLTTSRADFGICLPMIQFLKEKKDVELEMIVSGSHLMMEHGNTVEEVNLLGLKTHCVEVDLKGHSAAGTALSFAECAHAFANFWTNNHDFHLIFALGDRYEMAAALMSTIPFGLRIAHLCGGDVTAGATDQMYRDMISMIATYHFTTEEKSAERVRSIKRTYSNQIVLNVGSLAIEQLMCHQDMHSLDFVKKFGLNYNQDFVLITIHPETMNLHHSHEQVNAIHDFLQRLLKDTNDQLLITLPNADATSDAWRGMLLRVAEENVGRVFCHQSMGVNGYYTAMRNCKVMIGNSSSGIVEAATFGTWVINIGDRQLGRTLNENVFNVPFNVDEIWSQYQKVPKEKYFGGNVYGKGDTSKQIWTAIESIEYEK